MTPIKYITYKGEKWPFRISYLCIKKFREETGKDLDAIDEDISLFEVMLWHGLVAGHIAEGKPMTLKREDMELILDESMNELSEMMSTPIFFPPASEGPADANKKK